jgi:hypothetical protein
LLSTDDLVGHHRAEERRHRHAAVGDRDIAARRPQHRPDRRQMIAGDRPNGDANRLRFDLADRIKTSFLGSDTTRFSRSTPSLG